MDVSMGGISISGILPTARNPPGVHAHTPYCGDFNGGSWNSQALFAASCHKQFAKRGKATYLANRHDFWCYEETHAQEGRTLAYNPPNGTCALWANGSTRQAGIGIVLKYDFLKKFDAINLDHDFIEVVPGRIAILHLKGPQGNLDIICTYLDATSSAARRKAIHKLASHLRPQSTTLSILLGDFKLDPGSPLWDNAC